MDAVRQEVVLHFRDGTLQAGDLLSSLLYGKSAQFLPHSAVYDRRRAQRKSVVKEVKVDDLGVRRAIDLSSHGIFIDSLTMYPEGRLVVLSFKLQGETIQLDARVVYNEPGIGMGLEFIAIPVDLQIKIDVATQGNSGGAMGDPKSDRRAGPDRRISSKIPEYVWKRPSTRIRYQDRRNTAPASGKPVDLDFSKIKAVFFQAPVDFPRTHGQAARITLRDREKVEGILYHLSPEAMGVMLDLPIGENEVYSIFIIKSTILRVEYL